MPQGKPKTRYNFDKETCKYTRPGNAGYCDLPKWKRCDSCIRITNGDKACEVEL